MEMAAKDDAAMVMHFSLSFIYDSINLWNLSGIRVFPIFIVSIIMKST